MNTAQQKPPALALLASAGHPNEVDHNHQAN
jgi:hypothetical protein